MTIRADGLQDRNAIGLLTWKARVRAGFQGLDPRRPYQRDFWAITQARKLEAARSFLDRLKYIRREVRRELPDWAKEKGDAHTYQTSR